MQARATARFDLVRQMYGHFGSRGGLNFSAQQKRNAVKCAENLVVRVGVIKEPMRLFNELQDH